MSQIFKNAQFSKPVVYFENLVSLPMDDLERCFNSQFETKRWYFEQITSLDLKYSKYIANLLQDQASIKLKLYQEYKNRLSIIDKKIQSLTSMNNLHQDNHFQDPWTQIKVSTTPNEVNNDNASVDDEKTINHATFLDVPLFDIIEKQSTEGQYCPIKQETASNINNGTNLKSNQKASEFVNIPIKKESMDMTDDCNVDNYNISQIRTESNDRTRTMHDVNVSGQIRCENNFMINNNREPEMIQRTRQKKMYEKKVMLKQKTKIKKER